jgi:hypothetical protein
MKRNMSREFLADVLLAKGQCHKEVCMAGLSAGYKRKITRVYTVAA